MMILKFRDGELTVFASHWSIAFYGSAETYVSYMLKGNRSDLATAILAMSLKEFETRISDDMRAGRLVCDLT